MRFTYHPSIYLASLLLATSCVHNAKDESQAMNNSIFSEQLVVNPVSEMSIIGRWESKDNPLYPILEFKGKSTVVISTILGPYASSYERDEEFIRVKTDKSDLLFEIVSEDSIVGSGFAKGIWLRKN